MTHFSKLLLVLVIVSLIPALSHAQACIGGFDPGCSPDDPCPCPIDNDVIVLIAAVIGMAGYSALRLKKRKLAV